MRVLLQLLAERTLFLGTLRLLPARLRLRRMRECSFSFIGAKLIYLTIVASVDKYRSILSNLYGIYCV